MPGPKTNEREGTRAVLRHSRTSPYKVREVLDLIRNKPVGLALDILQFSERDAAILVGKLLRSAVANAETNDGMDPEELFVSACYADEGPTIKRWRPRARGRATRIRKRTCHVTVIVSRLPDDQLVRLRARQQAELNARRSRRVAGSRDDRARRVRGGQPDAAEVAAIEEEEGIVDQDAAAIAAAEDALAPEGAVDATSDTAADEAVADDAVTDAVTEEQIEATAPETASAPAAETEAGATDAAAGDEADAGEEKSE
jgi:large subunit ribosomal protein L22